MVRVRLQPNESAHINFPAGWIVDALVDDDGHLNVYVQFPGAIEVMETESGDHCIGNNELSYRFTTREIEAANPELEENLDE